MKGVGGRPGCVNTAERKIKRPLNYVWTLSLNCRCMIFFASLGALGQDFYKPIGSCYETVSFLNIFIVLF